jgi:ferredoxin
MKTRIREHACQGHAMCAITCPDVFHTDAETGHAFVIGEHVPPNLEDDVRAARDSCPEEAIEIY